MSQQTHKTKKLSIKLKLITFYYLIKKLIICGTMEEGKCHNKLK